MPHSLSVGICISVMADEVQMDESFLLFVTFRSP